MSPRLSIVTVNLNNRTGLDLTVESVVSQTYRDFEFIVVDGGSTDGSVEVIRKNEAAITRSVSEKDSGIYEAMNKGIRLATGEYCLFLNSGDWLVAPDVLARVFGPAWPAKDIVYGDHQTQRGRYSYPPRISLGTLFTSSIGHNVAFIRRRLFEQCGYYNENLRIAADWEFFITAFVLHNCTYQHIDTMVSFFDESGVSSSEAGGHILRREREETLRRLVPALYHDYVEHARDKDELGYYRESRLVQCVRRLQSSSAYRMLRSGRSQKPRA